MNWLKRLWIKFRLWRTPYVIGFDPGIPGSEKAATVYGKWLDGVLYIQKIDFSDSKSEDEEGK